MPLTAQALYFHLVMRADDDGFVDSPKKIQRIVRASEDDLRVLIGKQFLIPFDTGVLVIKHWRIHNVIRKDMYKPTLCGEEKAMLEEDSTGMYQIRNEHVTNPLRICTESEPNTTQDRTVNKYKLNKSNLINNEQSEIAHESDQEQFESLWEMYPNKKGKKRAFEAFKRAVKKGVSIDQIRDGINAYVKYINDSGIDMRYVKQGATFFAQESWNDDWTPEKPKNAFNQFEHNTYDFDELEKELLGDA